jgi:hypothetical protein
LALRCGEFGVCLLTLILGQSELRQERPQALSGGEELVHTWNAARDSLLTVDRALLNLRTVHLPNQDDVGGREMHGGLVRVDPRPLYFENPGVLETYMAAHGDILHEAMAYEVFGRSIGPLVRPAEFTTDLPADCTGEGRSVGFLVEATNEPKAVFLLLLECCHISSLGAGGLTAPPRRLSSTPPATRLLTAC